MSDTPRTYALSDSGKAHYMALDFASELERENEKLRGALRSIAGYPSVLWDDKTTAMFAKTAEGILKDLGE